MFIADAQTLYINVKDYGALGDGITDDTTFIQDAINALTSGGTVLFPVGTYMISSSITFPVNGIHLLGVGKASTILKKSANIDLIDMSGTATGFATHIKNCSIKEMTLHGNNKTGKLVRCYYTSLALFDSLYFFANNDIAIESAEFWDSYFTNCFWEFCGDTAGTLPSIYLKNAAATVGNFGYSTDNTNMIWFVNCHWESFYAGALWIASLNGNTNNPNGIYLVNCKMESTVIMGTFISLASQCQDIKIKNLYIAGDTFNSGFSTPVPAITMNGGSGCSFDDIFINANHAVFKSGIDLSPSGGPIGIHNVNGFGTAPTVGFINFVGGVTAKIDMSNTSSQNGIGITNNSGSTTVYPFSNYFDKYNPLTFASSITPSLFNAGNLVFVNPVTAIMTINAPTSNFQGAKLTFVLTSDSTGLYALTWNAAYKANQNALPTAMPGPNLSISVSFICDGTNWYRVN